MAASGAMADFARLPPQKKAMVFIAIGLALGLLYHRFVYKPLAADVAQAEQENAQKAQLNTRLAADIPKYEELKLRMRELDQIIKENQKALPTEAEVPAFFETLERKVKESGVQILKWQKLPEAPFDSFVKVPVEIEISGTFMQIKRFFASLVQRGIVPAADGQVEERERVISIDNLSLTQPTVVSREIRLNAKFIAVTFRQQDSAAPPPGAVVPTAPTAPAPPPLPSAGTPAGAKARTEQSINKGDAINRDAQGVDEAKTPAGAGSARLKDGI